MRNPKFKVGDKVKVLRASTDEEGKLWGDSWCGYMGTNIGKVMTIDKSLNYDNNYMYYKYKLKEDKGGYWYPEFVLQKKDVKGEQLLFEFMKE